MPDWQTIFFDSETGHILAVERNKYIRHKAEVKLLTGRDDLTNVRFFYVPYTDEIDPRLHHVVLSPPYGIPHLTDRKGQNLTLLSLQKRRAKQLKDSQIVVIKLEGGLGDYLMQADSVAYMTTIYQDKIIHLQGMANRKDIFLSCINNTQVHYNKPITPSSEKVLRLDMGEITSTDLLFPPYGKAGIYSCLMGIPPGVPYAPIFLPSSYITEARRRLKRYPNYRKGPILALHRRSGEPNSKTWPWENAAAFIKSVIDKLKATVILIGGHTEEKYPHPCVYDAIGGHDWMEIAALVYLSDVVVAIDSAIMHIALRLQKKLISLWGPTHWSYILNKNEPHEKIMGKCPKGPCYRYECREFVCMKAISPRKVINETRRLLQIS